MARRSGAMAGGTAEGSGRGAGEGPEGEPGGGLAGLYPPLMVYSWDDKGVWFAEIFFRFSGRLGQCVYG